MAPPGPRDGTTAWRSLPGEAAPAPAGRPSGPAGPAVRRAQGPRRTCRRRRSARPISPPAAAASPRPPRDWSARRGHRFADPAAVPPARATRRATGAVPSSRSSPGRPARHACSARRGRGTTTRRTSRRSLRRGDCPRTSRPHRSVEGSVNAVGTGRSVPTTRFNAGAGPGGWRGRRARAGPCRDRHSPVRRLAPRGLLPIAAAAGRTCRRPLRRWRGRGWCVPCTA